MELFQMAEITASFTDLGMKQILWLNVTTCKIYVYTNLKFTFRFLFHQLSCFCQVWPKILAKNK
jgi:hypothetical protein